MALKVLHVIGSLGLGGAQVSLKTIVENVRGDVEHVIYPLRPQANDVHIDAEIICMPYPNYDIRKLLEIVSLCKSRNIDIVHAHLSKPIIGALLAAPYIRSKVIVHEHSSVFDRRTSFAGYVPIFRLLRGRASGVIAVSRCVANALSSRMRIPRELIAVIPNAVDFRIFDPAKVSREDARRRLGYSGDDIVLCFVGRLDAIKGPDLALAALTELASRSPRYKLIFAGKGSMEKRLREMAKKLGPADKIRLLGVVEDVSQTMAACDIGLLPSREEALGISGLEFMRMKVPLVCSGAGGMAEYAIDGVTAMVTQQNTPASIAAAVEKISNDASLRARLVEAAFSACERFGIEAQAQAVLSLYHKVLGQGP